MKHYRFDRAKAQSPFSIVADPNYKESPRFITAKDMYYIDRYTNHAIRTLKNNMAITEFVIHDSIEFKCNTGSAKLFLIEYNL